MPPVFYIITDPELRVIVHFCPRKYTFLSICQKGKFQRRSLSICAAPKGCLRAARSAALTVHRTVIHYRRLRYAYPLHK